MTNMVVSVQDVFRLKQVVNVPGAHHDVDVLFLAEKEEELDKLVQAFVDGVEDCRIIESPALPRYVFDDDFTVDYTAFIAPDGRDMSGRYPQLFGLD